MADTRTVRELYFIDSRAPVAVCQRLEKWFGSLLSVDTSGGLLAYRGGFKMNGMQFDVLLRYEAAFLLSNEYLLRIGVSWPPGKNEEYFQRSQASWLDLWTKDLTPAKPAVREDGWAALYQSRMEEALRAEARLASVEAIQEEIVDRMCGGASFFTAHKEGGTNVRYRNGRFVAADYGESDKVQTFATEAEFLAWLRQFYDWETRRNVYPAQIPEIDAWKMILRLMHDA